MVKIKKIKVFDYKGEEINGINIVEVHNDKGNWLEFL